MLKYSCNGETWVQSTPYHSPSITKLFKKAEPVAPKPVELETVNKEEEERKVSAPVIPTPPPLPPIMAPVQEEEEEEEEVQPTPEVEAKVSYNITSSLSIHCREGVV